MLRNIKLTIEYDGTDFLGWQIQKKGSRTVQEEIKKAIKKIFKQDVHVIGSGRTDAGVHALAQVANVKLKTDMPCDEIRRALNGNLTDDISILKVEDAPLKFHAQFDAKEKIYRYTIINRASRQSVGRRYVLFYPHKIDLKVIKEEAELLIGKKDFKSFQSKDPAKLTNSTVRTMKSIKIQKKNDVITLDFTADGFLYRMVRNVVGTLLEVGIGKRPLGSVTKILSQKNRIYAGPTAKAHGLTLWGVRYKN